MRSPIVERNDFFPNEKNKSQTSYNDGSQTVAGYDLSTSNYLQEIDDYGFENVEDEVVDCEGE